MHKCLIDDMDDGFGVMSVVIQDVNDAMYLIRVVFVCMLCGCYVGNRESPSVRTSRSCLLS